MKKSNIIILILAVLLIVVSSLFIKVNFDNKRIEKNMDDLFMSTYHNLTLNMLNQTVEGISDNVIQIYKEENIQYRTILTHCYSYTSYYKNKNKDLNYIIDKLIQTYPLKEIEMDIELYRKLKVVSNDYFNNAEILKTAREGIENSLQE